jgi:uncharacterized protein YbjT (DUF2867 family)
MRILILGASGFIGSNLTRYATAQGHEVVALCRSGLVPGFNGTSLKWALGQDIPSDALHRAACAIHLAYDFDGAAGARLTLEATCAGVAQLRAAGIPRQIFFSSYSAGEHATSRYGRTKLAIERGLAGSPDSVIVRPGLVLGQGGIYGRIRRWAERWPVIPLPDGGHGQVPVITLERLCRETLAIAEAPQPAREVNLFEHELRSLRRLVLDAAAEAGRHPWLIPIPSALIVVGLRAGEFLHLPLPVNADNLAGFLANQQAGHISTLQGSESHDR